MEQAAEMSNKPGGDPADSSDRRADVHWPLFVLTGPALVRVGDRVLPAAARVWLDILVELVRTTLENALGRSVSLTLQAEPVAAVAARPAGSLEVSPVVFGVDFSHGECDDGLLTLDVSAARALVDPTIEALTGLRGGGPLTEGEAGVVEYVLLALADGVLQQISEIGRGFEIRRFHGPSEIDARLRDAPGGGLEFILVVSGRSGRVRLYGGDWSSAGEMSALVELPETAAQTLARARADRTVELQLGLPTVSLTRQEYQALQPGDVVLLGRTDLASPTCGCNVLTTTGWCIADAEIHLDSPTVVSARCGPLRPTPGRTAAPSGDTDIVSAIPVMGRLEVTLEQLARWGDEHVLDMPKDAQSPVGLCVAGARKAAGELVRVDGEIGIRVTALFPTAGGEPEDAV